jgi:alpha-1,2-mannosyltransferase
VSGAPPATAGSLDTPVARRLLRAAPLVGCLAWTLDAVVMAVWGRGWSLDLRVYLLAGRAFLRGAPVYPAFFTAQHLPFTYPPFALVVLSPLSRLPIPATEVLWWVLDAVALTATVAIALRRSVALRTADRWWLAAAIAGVAALCLEPVRANTDYGQINVVLMLMVVADLLAVRGRRRGLLVGFGAALKLTPLFFVLYFVVDRDRRALGNALGSFLCVTGLTWLLLPGDSTHYFVHELLHPSRFGRAGSIGNEALSGIFHRTPFASAAASTALWLAASLVVTVVVCYLAQLVIGQSPVQAVVAVGLGALLVSPLSWSHHWCWLVLLPIVAWERRGSVAMLALCALVTLDAIVAPYAYFHRGASRAIGSCTLVVVTLALLAVWLVEARATRRAPPARAVLA